MTYLYNKVGNKFQKLEMIQKLNNAQSKTFIDYNLFYRFCE